MKKQVIPLLAGIVVSYCFSSMILNQKIVNPVIAYHNKSIVIGWDELLAGCKDFEVVDENQLRSTSTDPWIELTNVRGQVGRLRSVTYKVKPIGQDAAIKTQLCYADTDAPYTNYRSVIATFTGETTVIEIPDYAGSIDKLRLDLTSQNNVVFELDQIAFNLNYRFSGLLMAFIYLIWCMVIFLEPRSRVNGSKTLFL